MPPTSKQVTKDSLGKNKTKKYTILDSQTAFLMLAPTVESSVEKINTLSDKGLPVQPFIVIIGELLQKPTEILVYYNTIKYKVSTVVKAVDICFKIFQVFDYIYPPAASAVWLFIQSYFYNIHTKHDVQFLSVIQLEQKLKKQKLN